MDISMDTCSSIRKSKTMRPPSALPPVLSPSSSKQKHEFRQLIFDNFESLILFANCKFNRNCKSKLEPTLRKPLPASAASCGA